MYINQRAVQIPKSTALQQENELLKLQVYALQQKRITNETEIKELHTEINKLCSNTSSMQIQESNNRDQNNKLRRVPYVFEITESNKNIIEKNVSQYYYIEDDEGRGLGSPGKSGYIKCDGHGDITYRLYDKVEDTWSFPATLKAGESDEFKFTDNVRINTVEITPNSDETMFRLRFSSGI
uniref:Uncharacterized protein n=1 Tax=viral metagenome TaxID=1070528 RepID=A0A6M3L874_9ZZZZ